MDITVVVILFCSYLCFPIFLMKKISYGKAERSSLGEVGDTLRWNSPPKLAGKQSKQHDNFFFPIIFAFVFANPIGHVVFQAQYIYIYIYIIYVYLYIYIIFNYTIFLNNRSIYTSIINLYLFISIRYNFCFRVCRE